MKLMCLWCLSEGRMAFLGVRGSMADSNMSHDICDGHLVQSHTNALTTRITPSSYHENPTLPTQTLPLLKHLRFPCISEGPSIP